MGETEHADRKCRTLSVRRLAERVDQPPPPAKGARDPVARRVRRRHRNRRATIARAHRDRAAGISPRARGDPEPPAPRTRGLSISSVRKSDLTGHRPADGHFQGGGEGVDAPRPRAHRRRNGARTVSGNDARSEEHTSELQSLMRISYAVFCLKKKIQNKI